MNNITTTKISNFDVKEGLNREENGSQSLKQIVLETRESRSYYTETQIKEIARKEIKKRGWFQFGNAAGKFSMKGISDMTILANGNVIFVEFKKEIGGIVSQEQHDFSKKVLDHGVPCLKVWNVKTLNILYEFIENLPHKKTPVLPDELLF